MRVIGLRTTGLALAALAFVLVSSAARDAAAYPMFQFSSGTTRCNQCHYSPGGGGLLTAWGRDESADTISMGGNGAFLHGAVTLPAWLNIGGDFRFAGIASASGGPMSPELAFFPMQLDAYLRFAFGESF